MNSGIVLWVEDNNLAQAQRILASIDTDDETGADLLDNMSDAELGILPENEPDSNIDDKHALSDNKGGEQ